MAKRVRLSLAMKLRLLFGAAVLGIIAAALVVPWYFLELLAEQAVQQRGTADQPALVINEHLRDPKDPAIGNQVAVALRHRARTTGGAGPLFIKLSATSSPTGPWTPSPAPPPGCSARRPARTSPSSRPRTIRAGAVYRSFRAVRAEPACMKCHGPAAAVEHQFQPGQLVGMVDVTVPAEMESRRAAVVDARGVRRRGRPGDAAGVHPVRDPHAEAHPPPAPPAPHRGRQGRRGRPDRPQHHPHRRRAPAPRRELQRDARRHRRPARAAPRRQPRAGPQARRAGPGQRGAVRGQPGQDRVPGQRLPRAAHAAEQHHRVRRPAGRVHRRAHRAATGRTSAPRPRTCWA